MDTEEAGKDDLVSKLKSSFDKHFNLILIGVLLFAFLIRLKYMTVNAALWWDEADYMSLAKHYGLGLPEQAAPWRARALSMVMGLFYFLGANEWFMHLLWIIASVAGVYFTYKIGNELYGRVVGIIAALGMSVYFEYLFWSVRFSADVFLTLIFTAIIYLFWKGYVEKKGNKYLYIAAALLGFGVFAYESIAFVILVLLLFLLITEKLSFLKSRQMWYAIGIALLLMVPFFIYNQIEFGNLYPRLWHQAVEFNIEMVPEPDWARPTSEVVSDLLMYSKNIPYYFKWPFMIAFVVGLASFINLFIGFDLIWKGGSDKLKKDLFVMIWCIVILVLFSFILAFTGFYFEPRFLLPIMPALFIIAGRGFVSLYDLLKKYSAPLALALILLLLGFGLYSQLAFADQLIEYKKDAYAAENPAGTWLKEHTKEGDVVVGCGQAVQILYYSERKFYSFGSNASRAEDLINKHRPKYFMMDGHDPACQNVLNYPAEHPERFKLLQVFFADKEKTQPIMAIFEVIYTGA